MTKFNVHLPSTILLIEDDLELRDLILEILTEHQIIGIDSFTNGEDAWKNSQIKPYDLVILDWKLPKLSGVALLNRFRKTHYYKKVPILIISGYLTKKDLVLFDEFPITGRLEKPFGNKRLISNIKNLWAESQWYRSQEFAIRRIFDQRAAENCNFIKEAEKLIDSSPKPLPLVLLVSRTLRWCQKYDDAERIIKEATAKYKAVPALMAELGRVYLANGRYDKSYEILTNAANLSPLNLERYCSLGNIDLQRMEPQKAMEHFNKVLGIDPGNQLALGGKRLAHNMKDYLDDNNASKIPDSYVAMLNSIGVAMVGAKRFSDGIKHYKSALMYTVNIEQQAKIYFNLGLAYFRWQKPKPALAWFNKAQKFAQDKTKIIHYIERIKELGEGDGHTGISEADTAEPNEHIDLDYRDYLDRD